MHFSTLGIDFAVAVLVEAIDHDAVVADQVLEDRRGLLAQRPQRARADDGLQRALDIAGQIMRRAGALELDKQAAIGWRMHQHVEVRGRASYPAAKRDRRSVHGLDLQRPDLAGQIAAEAVERAADQIRLGAEERLGIGTVEENDAIGAAHEQ
jgi:hypothetical protein